MSYIVEKEETNFQEEQILQPKVVDFFADENEQSPVEEIRETVVEKENFALNRYENWNSGQEIQIDFEQEWEDDAWLDRWRMNPELYLVTAMPPDLSQRMDSVLKEKKMKRNDFVLKALEDACKKVELEKLRRKGLKSGDMARLIKDPKTGKLRCFPADFFTEDELFGFEVLDGKYYLIPWEKAEDGWIQVNKGYFEAADRDAPYIKMVNNRPVGSWEVYPFEFFEDGWSWGVYEHDVIIEVRGRQDIEGLLWLDVYIDGELVDAVRNAREVHRIIVESS